MAVRARLEQRRAAAAAGAVDGRARRVADRPHVVAVDDRGGDPVRVRAAGDVRSRRHLLHRRELAVEVVLAHEHDGQRRDLREVQALVEVRLVGGAVAEERDRDVAGALRRQRGAGRGADRPADDAEAADQAVLEVDDVHRAGAPAADAGRAAEHLGGEPLGVGAERQRVAVAAVGAGDPVAVGERRADADRDRLLARRTGASCRAPRRAGRAGGSPPRTAGSAASGA